MLLDAQVTVTPVAAPALSTSEPPPGRTPAIVPLLSPSGPELSLEFQLVCATTPADSPEPIIVPEPLEKLRAMDAADTQWSANTRLLAMVSRKNFMSAVNLRSHNLKVS